MNIGIVTAWNECGAGYVSRSYMNLLREKGNNVYIYARGGRCYPRGDPNWDLPNVTWGIRYEPSTKVSKFNNQYINMLHFEKWLFENNIDIIITNEDIRFELVKRVKALGYSIGTYIDYYRDETINEFKAYDFLLCNTKRHYSVFKHMRQAIYIPWGTDIDVFMPKIEKKNEKNNNLIFFHNANYGGRNCRKGTDLLLRAFCKIKGEIKLIIHSQVPISKFGYESSEIIRNDPRIKYINKTVSAPGLYHLGDVFVYPSRLEGIGLCVPEALACGMPVITTDTAPMNEFVKHDENGFLIRVKKIRKREDNYYWPEKIADVEDLANKMLLYIENRKLFLRHKMEARKSAVENLDWKKNASKLSVEMTSIIKQKKSQVRRPRIHERIVWVLEASFVAFLTHSRNFFRKILKRI
jgi:glycosyltransferase involved in cell wall biosynthesis